MKFFAFASMMVAAASASYLQTDEEKEQAFETWAAQARSGEISPEVFLALAQALDESPADEDDLAQLEDFSEDVDDLAEIDYDNQYVQVDYDIDEDLAEVDSDDDDFAELESESDEDVDFAEIDQTPE